MFRRCNNKKMSAGMDLQTEAPPGCGAGSVYSHRKKRTERAVQSAVTPNITQIGNSIPSAPMPRNAFFIIVSPCVSGKKPTTFCIAFGITSMGSVVPEKTSMGK